MPKTLRFKCPKCGNVSDSPLGAPCRKCNTILTDCGGSYLQIYRMGSPLGIAGGFGIYLNNQPYGYIGNRQSVRIPLPYGTYQLHVAVGMNRRCEDLLVELTPDRPKAFVKVHMNPGFFSNKFVPEFAREEDMPPMD